MKKIFSFMILIAMLFLVGCVESSVPSDDDNQSVVTQEPVDTEEPIVSENCTYTDDLALIGFTDYTNIKKVKICKEYVDILTEILINLDLTKYTIVFHDEEELVYFGRNGIYYRYKDEVLEEHDIFDVTNMDWIKPGVLTYVKDSSTLYALYYESDIYGSNNEIDIAKYNMDTKEYIKLPIDLGRDPKFVHVGVNGFVIEAYDKLLIFDENFELIKESTEAVFLGASKHQIDKENEFILVGESVNNQCEVTIYKGSLPLTISLNDSCDSVRRLDVYSAYTYFIINKKLYKFDAITKTFSLVPLSTDGENVDYVINDNIYRNNKVFGLVLSENYETVFNNNMDISQSSNAMNVVQVGETFYLAQKPNSNDIYIYNFDVSEILEIEEEFSYTRIDNNHLIIYKNYCTLMNCQNIYRDGTELVLSDVKQFNAVNHDNAIYVDNVSSTTYDIMHINFETNVTKKLMSLDYSLDPYVNYNTIYALPNGLIIIRDSFTSQFHFYDANGEFIESTRFIAYYKTVVSSSQVYLLRENGEVILFNYFF